MNNYENYGKINKDYTINNQNDDAFESTIKEERKRQKNIFAGNDVNYSKNMRYQQEKIHPSQDTMKVQKTLNEYGYTDQQGKKLKVDGAYGPKTDYAFNNAYNANKSVFENREKQRKRDEIMPLVTSAYDNMFADASTRKFASNKDEVVNTKKFLNQLGYTDMLDRKLEENDTWDTNSKIAFEKYAWDGIPRQEVLDLQKSLNKNGIADKDGNPLLEDGKYSKKFYDAVNNAFKTLDGKFDTAIKRGDTPKLTKGEIINLAADAYTRLLKEYGPEEVKDTPVSTTQGKAKSVEPVSNTYAVNTGAPENSVVHTNNKAKNSVSDIVSNIVGKEDKLPKAQFGPISQEKTPSDPLESFQQRIGKELREELGLDKNNKKYANDTEHLNDYFWNNKYDTEDIKGVQKVLSSVSGVNLAIDGDIGVNTSSAIAKYAKDNGLTLEQAGDRLVELGRAFNEVEALGLSGEEIKTIQQKLNQLGITDIDGDKLDEDNILGESTVSAIDKYAKIFNCSFKDAIKKMTIVDNFRKINNTYISSTPVNPELVDEYNLNYSNRAKAVNYAMYYGNATKENKKGNSDYNFYDSNCTNFVSQCLLEGGFKMDDEWWYDYERKFRENSAEWGVADHLYRYLTGVHKSTVAYVPKGSEVSKVANRVKPGDIIAWNNLDDVEPGIINHVAIVSKVENGIIYYCGNTSPRVDHPLTNVNPNVNLYFVNVNYPDE